MPFYAVCESGRGNIYFFVEINNSVRLLKNMYEISKAEILEQVLHGRQSCGYSSNSTFTFPTSNAFGHVLFDDIFYNFRNFFNGGIR